MLICLLLVSTFLASTDGQTTSILHPTNTFPIPSLNSWIQFATEVNYTTARFENNTWFFSGLRASGKAGYPISGHLHISATNCTVSISYLQAWTQPEIGSMGMQWIRYNVMNGSGTQTLDTNDLFPNSKKWTEWTVKINGEKVENGTFWNLSNSGMLTISTQKPSLVEVSVIHVAVDSSTAPLPAPEPALHDFTSADHFPIPASNGSINFEVAGSYDKVSLEGNIWNFENLTLNNYAINAGIFAPNVTGRDVLPYILQCGYPANVGISVVNCNVTVTGITPYTWHSHSPGLNFTVQGEGSQTFAFPFELDRFYWSAIIDGVPKPTNEDWFVNNYQLQITNATSNVSLIGELKPQSHPPNMILYNELISILAFGGTALLLIIAIIILVRRKRRASINSSFSS